MKRMFFSFSFLFFGLALFAADLKDPFPKSKEIVPPVRLKRNAAITVSKDGHLLADGEPRYLPGVLYYGTGRDTTVRNIGYPDELVWLYKDFLDYEGSQRIGFDAVGLETPLRWFTKYRPKENWTPVVPQMKRVVDSSLPLYVDFTCAGWHHGGLNAKRDGKRLPQEAFTPNGQFFPYSLVHPEGRALWLEMWRDGADYMVNTLGAKPMFYELFNEPGNNDRSPTIRAEFVRRLEKRFGTVGALNRVWRTNYKTFAEIGAYKRLTENPALNIEWNRFLEDLFYEICRDGIKAIREVDKRPEAGFCFQPLFMRCDGVNLYRTNQLMNRISSSTGGGDALQAHFLRAMADGKPISDGEMYTGKTRSSFRNAFLTQFSRGFNLSYIFKWTPRPFDWLTVYKKDADGKKIIDLETIESRAKLSAERFPYMVLNPYAVPTDALLGISDAKRDIADVNFLFAPRHRNVPRKAAFLYSHPTDYIAQALGHTNRMLLNRYSAALEYTHIPQDIIFEEQLAENRQTRYPVLIAAGVDGVYDETPDRLKRYVENGGILLLGQEVLDRNELSFPRESNSFPGIVNGKEIPVSETESFQWNGKSYPAALYRETRPDKTWTVLASIGKNPVFFEKNIGKGKVFFLNAKMPLPDLGRFLENFLAAFEISPVCRITDPDSKEAVWDVEVNKARRDGLTGYIVANRALGARLVRFTPDTKAAAWCRIRHADSEQPRILLVPEKDGSIFLELASGDNVILVGGNPADLEKRYGKMPVRSPEKALAEGRIWQKKIQDSSVKPSNAYNVDPGRIHPVDLRAHANRGFEDRIAGDGKGGWTDQGANSLRGTSWGIQNCSGVPMEFIRVDQNHGKTCIVLGSKKSEAPFEVKGIRVDRKAIHLYFLHATAFSGGHSFDYVIHYADGTSAIVPIRDGIEADDWYWLKKKSAMTAHPGWKNSEGRGLYLWRWSNPNPEKTIATLDIRSKRNNSIPIIAAISTEDPDPSAPSVKPLGGILKTSGGFRAVWSSPEKTIRVTALPAKEWSRLSVTLPEAYSIPADVQTASVFFELRACEGKLPPLNFTLAPSGKKMCFLNPLLEKIPGSEWLRVTIPLASFLSPEESVKTLMFRMEKTLENKAVFEIRNLQILQFRANDPFSMQTGNLFPFVWHGRDVQTGRGNGTIFFRLTDKAQAWCGGGIHLKTPWKRRDGTGIGKNPVLQCRVNSIPDAWGKHYAIPGIQIALNGIDGEGKEISSGYITLQYHGKTDTDPETWHDASVNLNLARKNFLQRLRELRSIHVQFKHLDIQRSGVEFKDFKLDL